MTTNTHYLSMSFAFWLGGAVLAGAQGTAFTYQGRLTDNGAPATGSYDMQFTLFDDPTNGTVYGVTTVTDVVASNGLFTVTLDFGPGAFDGQECWMEIRLRAAGSLDSLLPLTPRQPITATPYALMALHVPGLAINGGNLGVGISPPAARLHVNGDIRVADDADLYGLDALYGYNDLRLYGDTNGAVADVFIAAGGNVGFGTHSPMSRLAVAQAGQLSNIGLLSFAELDQEVFTFRGDFAGSGPAGNALRLSSLWNPFVMTWHGDGRVGIGTTNPSSALHVNGDIRVADDADLHGLDALYGYNDLRLYGDTNGGPDVYVAADGRVGVGTASPLDARLDLEGDLRLNDYEIYLRGGSDRNHGLGWYGNSGTFAGFNVDGPILYGYGGGGLGTTVNVTNVVLTWRANGNVGIGTVNPGSKLSVANAGQIDGAGLLSFAESTQEVFTFRGDFAGGGAAGDALRLSSLWNPNVMIWRGDGSVGIGTTNPQSRLDVNGEITTVAINITSDRCAKEQFTGIDAQAILKKVAQLKISEWQYKDHPGSRHIGPMAQDFYAAFQCGPDERHIATVDADGVALAAIQGLYERLLEREAELNALQKRVAELEVDEAAREARMIALERRVAAPVGAAQQAAWRAGGGQ
jgi:hypothetical protein